MVSVPKACMGGASNSRMEKSLSEACCAKTHGTSLELRLCPYHAADSTSSRLRYCRGRSSLFGNVSNYIPVEVEGSLLSWKSTLLELHCRRRKLARHKCF